MTEQKYTLFEPISTKFSEAVGKMGNDEKQYYNKAVEAYKRGETIDFCDYIHKEQWKYFYEQTKGIAGSIELTGPLPIHWPVDAKMNIKVFNAMVYKKLQEMLSNKKQFPFLGIKRDAKQLDKHFLLTYGSVREHERECVMQALERLQVLDNSLYSRPAGKEELQKHVNIDYIFPIRNNNIKYRNIEGTDKVLEHELKYTGLKVGPTLYEAAKRTHCWVVLDCFPFNDNVNGTPSEKFLWPLFLGIPFIYIGSQQQREVLTSWGVTPNDSFSTDVRSTCEQMMWLKSIFNDPHLAQQWQNKQGPLIIENRKALDSLAGLLRNNPA